MTKAMLLCGVVLTIMPFLLPAKDFPLEFKTLTAPEAMSFPGGVGSYGMIQPAGRRALPKSRRRSPSIRSTASYRSRPG